MPRKKSTIRNYTEGDYSRMYERIEKEIDIEDYDMENVRNIITNKGYNRLGEERKQKLKDIVRIDRKISSSTNIEELRILREDILRLPIYQQELLIKVIEKMTSLSITLTEQFARERKVTLTEKVKGNIENWKGEIRVITIRKNGKFVSWKKL